MQSTPRASIIEKVRYDYLIILGLILLSAFSIAVLGIWGLAFAILGIAGLIVTPFLYNKPTIFLFFSLFIYPLTRILSMDDKFIITGALYALSLPCTFWIMKKYFGSVSNKSFYLWAMLLYIAIVLLNYLRPGTSIVELAKEFGRTFFAIFTILSVHHYVESNPENFNKMAKYLSYVLNIIALIGIGQYLTKTGGMSIEGFYRARGTFYNFNEYGYVISIFICFALYILLTTQKERFYWVFTIGLNLIALAATFSKTSIVNTALIFIIMSFFLPWKRKLQLLATALITGSLLGFYLAYTGLLNALILRFMDTSSLQWRYEMWNRLYHMIMQGNILLGQGLNASKGFLALVMPAHSSNAPHNVYLETMYNLGLVGLIAFVLIFLFILIQGFRILFDKTKVNSQIIGTAIIVIATITIVQNYVSNAFYDRAGNAMFWAMLTLLVCQYNHSKVIVRNKFLWR